jgi:hypothetical protein
VGEAMKEKYSFGYTDPRAMYGSVAVELEEPPVKWEFLERNQYETASLVTQLIFIAVVIILGVLI